MVLKAKMVTIPKSKASAGPTYNPATTEAKLFSIG